MQLLTFFVVGPALAIAIAYGAWRGKQQNLNPVRYGMLCITSGVAAFLLFGFAKWINADVRTAQYFLELACVLLSGLFFGVFVGVRLLSALTLVALAQDNTANQCGRTGNSQEMKLQRPTLRAIRNHMPEKSHFDQVRRTNGFDGLNLLKSTRFCGRLGAGDNRRPQRSAYSVFKKGLHEQGPPGVA
jgi:hypothetical protein